MRQLTSKRATGRRPSVPMGRLLVIGSALSALALLGVAGARRWPLPANAHEPPAPDGAVDAGSQPIVPPIDAAVSGRTEMATFALG